ncbi:related to Mitochondrial N(5)-glutamine methyltransferase MTQ1 [Hanseniaspora guilliermondii]|uniref:Related to Mitochondrial N(5)-glutamine methyltransferase MTQ1 n=1 Tax=Hanseniaspora guilliermondii TaxID=56406 RepID=A0A1L0FEX7_9ASCO|nr:related to Mitochondrial N(5)-glutamine methyltransferase MTQ1 [Hanseniaspora guilliermondii]
MRINRQLIKKAKNINPLLPYLLPQCRTIENASTELRWINEHFSSKPKSEFIEACKRRYKGMPLQYILGTQPFGKNLNILCKKNVLIPRWETDEITSFLNDVLLKKRLQTIRENQENSKKIILDLCTGSGCISASIKESYPDIKDLFIYGIDVSKACIDLAMENQVFNNLENNKGNYDTWLGYLLHDVLNPKKELFKRVKKMDEWTGGEFETSSPFIECIISNPPYIPHKQLSELNVSVKNYEPHKALFGELEFYKNFVDVWSPHCNSFFYELGDITQLDFIRNNLDEDTWTVHKWMDGNDKLRGVYGYRKSLKNDYEHYI